MVQQQEEEEEEEDDTSREDNLSPTKEEILTWSHGFDKVMQTPAGRQVFREFLKQEFSEENILFWNAVNELQNTNETNPLLVEEKARMIYEDFISILSPREVSLDSIAREIVNRKMVHPDKWTFNEAQEQIFMLMKRDSYPRFIISPLYKRLFNSTSSPTPQA